MSKPINPVAIGGFTVGAILLLVVGLLIFGGNSLFDKDTFRFVVFFQSSLNGLEVGAPVKMQGVKIGEVKEVGLQFDRANGKLYKPVVVEIQRSAMSGPNGAPAPHSASMEERTTNRDRLVAMGFRAQLQMQSLLTGLLYVDLDFYPNKPAVYSGTNYKDLLEIPGVPTTADELRNIAEEVMQKVRNIPIDDMIRDLASSLREVKELLASEDMKNSKKSLSVTLEQLEQTTKVLNHNLEPLLVNTNKTMESTAKLAADLQHDMQPLTANTNKALITATATLEQAEAVLRQTSEAMGPESPLTDSLQALRDAARSTRDLTDYLQRHPESLLNGKAQ